MSEYIIEEDGTIEDFKNVFFNDVQKTLINDIKKLKLELISSEESLKHTMIYEEVKEYIRLKKEIEETIEKIKDKEKLLEKANNFIGVKENG